MESSPANALHERSGSRVTSLDGLRGLAAGVVLIHHSLLVSPILAGAYLAAPTAASGWMWALTRTPLHLLWAGGEAVGVFFVLSGYVLWLQMAGADRKRWLIYYPQRMVRLYIPVFAAVAFASMLIVCIARQSDPMMSWWVNSHAGPLTATNVFHSMTLLIGVSPIDNPLWSLRVEVCFSLLLPIYGFAVRQGWIPWWLSVIFLSSAMEAGKIAGNSLFAYLPIFGFGVLLAHHQTDLANRLQELKSRSWAAIALVSLLLLSVSWTPWTIGKPLITPLPTAWGATLVVIIFIHCPTAVRVGDSWAAQFLGRISFSLYLIHEPIVVTTAFVLRTGDAFAVAVIAVPMALVIGWVFFRIVEKPSIRLSRAVGWIAMYGQRRPVLIAQVETRI
jgi:peptidoglycan/LPS O-acetylase OafA/YrhL